MTEKQETQQTARDKPPRTSVVGIITCKTEMINNDYVEEIIGELKTFQKQKTKNAGLRL